MIIHEKITLKEYQEIQIWYFMKKRRIDLYLAAVFLFGAGLMAYSIFARDTFYAAQLIIIFLPLIYRPFCIRKIKKLAATSYENDDTEWVINIKNDVIDARPKGNDGLTIVKIYDIYRAYELKSVMLVYVNKVHFITLAKKDIDNEKYKEFRTMIYDKLGSKKVKLKKQN